MLNCGGSSLVIKVTVDSMELSFIRAHTILNINIITKTLIGCPCLRVMGSSNESEAARKGGKFKRS